MRFFAGSVLVFAGFLSAPAWAQSEEQKWSPWIDVDGKAGTDRSLATVDLFAPIWQDGNSLVFLNPRARADDQDAQEYNIGLGYRTLQNEWAYGIYGYVDRNHSDTEHNYHQVTLGAEASTLDWKFRANLYQPFGNRKNTVAPTTGLSGTTLQVNSNVERSLHGADIEAGWRVPLHDAENLNQLWVYAGYFHFDASQVEDVSGPRLRMEYEIDHAEFLGKDLRLTFSGELQHDDVRDTDGFIGIRVGIPLGNAVPQKNLSAMERRLVDPVVRDVDIVTGVKTTSEEAVNPATGNPFNVKVIRAGDDVPAEVIAAGNDALVIFDGSAGAIDVTAPVNMQNGQIFLGAGSSLPIKGINSGVVAHFAPSGPQAHIRGDYENVGTDGVINVADNASILGLEISNLVQPSVSGRIVSVNAADFLIAHNYIHVVGSDPLGNADQLIYLHGNNTGVIRNNLIDTNGNNGEGISSFFATAGSLDIYRNTILSENGTGISGSNLTFTIEENTIYALGAGVGISGNLNTDSVIESNVIYTTDGWGIGWGDAVNPVISNNTIYGETANVRALEIGALTNVTGNGNRYIDASGAGTFCHVSVPYTGSVSFVGYGNCP